MVIQSWLMASFSRRIAEQLASLMNSSPTPVLRLPGSPSIAYIRRGDGPPLIFLHGIGGNRSSWQAQVDTFSTRFSCYAWDARGYGDSDDYDGDLQFETFADDLVRLIDHEGIDTAHFVGLSMGARILLDFVGRFPDRIASLCLCDCFFAYEQSLTPEKQAEFIALRQRPLLEGKSFAEMAPSLIESLVGPACSANVREQLRQSIEALHKDSYLKTLAASVRFNRAAVLSEIQVPVQLIFGADDRLTPPSIGAQMSEMIPNARLSVLDDSGHLSNMEQADAFNAALDAFLYSETGVSAISTGRSNA